MNKKQLKELLDDPYNFANRISIEDLVNILKKLSHHYYNKDTPLVPDSVFDLVRSVLKQRDPSNEFLKEVGSKKKDDIKLPFPMPSLDKIKPDTNVIFNWLKKYKGPYILSDKLDGMSCLVYNNKGIISLYTRGDGFEGSDISHLAKDIFKNINIPLNTAIRGELIIKKEDFRSVSETYKNIRNTVTTLRTRKIPDDRVVKISRFVAYSIVYPRYTQEKQMEILTKSDLETVYYEKRKKIDNEYLSSLLEKRRKDGDYDIDGIVVVDSSRVYPVDDSTPDHAFAFKQVLSDQVVESTVIDVKWEASKHGYLKPTVSIDPVNVNGVTISNATAHNAKFVVKNCIGPGALLKIVRSGDVIPKILEVLKPSATGKPKLPSVPHQWNSTKIDLILKDIHGEQKDIVLVKQLKHFFKTMSIKYLDEGVLKLLVEAGFRSVFDILKAKKKSFSDIPGLGEKTYDKIMKEIADNINNTNLETLMAASMCFDRGVGVKKLKLVLADIPNLLKTDLSDKDLTKKILDIKGFDTKTTELIVKGLTPFRKFFNELSKLFDLKYLEVKKKSTKKGTMKDFYVVFTGVRDKDIEDYIEKNGGTVLSTVSGKTTHLVYKEMSESSKFKKAKVLGVKIMTLAEFKKTYIK